MNNREMVSHFTGSVVVKLFGLNLKLSVHKDMLKLIGANIEPKSNAAGESDADEV